MKRDKRTVHPYIPNSVPEVQEEMLAAVGAASIEELYQDIPESLRFRGTMNLPDPLVAECDLRRHVREVLAKRRGDDSQSIEARAQARRLLTGVEYWLAPTDRPAGRDHRPRVRGRHARHLRAIRIGDHHPTA